jgi:uncharacterized protein YbjT (DUF2867 family)
VIVVTGAAGRTGAAVVRALTMRGRRVRAVVRTPRAVPGADVVVADLRDHEAMTATFRDASAVYVIWPNFDPDEATGVPAVFAAARRAGVGRVVYHSVLRPQARSMPHHALKDRAEEALDRSGLAWRVLQPCAYSANLDAAVLRAASDGVLPSAWGLDRGQSFVDVRDVADAAAVLLLERGLDGGTFEAAGPAALTARDVAARVSAAAGRDVRAVDAPPAGPVPPPEDWAAHCLRRMLDHYRECGFAGSPRVLEALLGRPARTFADHLTTLPLRAAAAVP